MTRNALSLFSGAGGGVIGFEQAGYNNIAAVDFDEECCDTLAKNHDDLQVIQADLSKTSPHEFAVEYEIAPSDVDIVVGGPPCKDFSVAADERTTESERANLVFRFATYVSFFDPEQFVMENVKGMLSMDDGEFFADLCDKFADAGYDVTHDVLNAAEYGVPQKRERVVVVGNGQLPEPTGVSRSVSDALDDLPSLVAGESSDILHHNAINHQDETVEKMKDVDNGTAKHPAYARAHPDEPSFTVIAGKSAPPVHHRQPRRLTVRETARLQTFPDEYYFVGTKNRRYQQVGNAFPPKLAKEVAKALRE